MKTAGVVFDFYDDLSGALLKRAFPTAEDLPEQIKTAHILVPEEHAVLRDEAYALVMNNEGKILRKFACVDAGNTLLSCLYFEANAHLLPDEAVKVAAANLADFCDEFGFEPTNFVKVAAANHYRQRDPGQQPLVGDEADWAARTNLVSVRGGADSGRVIPTANQMKTAGVKQACGGGVVLTDDKRNINTKAKMPPLQKKTAGLMDFVGTLKRNPRSDELELAFKAYEKATGKNRNDMSQADINHFLDKVVPRLKKTAAVLTPRETAKESGRIARKLFGMEKRLRNAPRTSPGKPKVDPEAASLQAQVMRDYGRAQRTLSRELPKKKEAGLLNIYVVKGDDDKPVAVPAIKTPKGEIVDVSGKDPKPFIAKKAAANYALDGQYPLDSYIDVKTAVRYFDENWTSMDPAQRHEFAVKTASRADEIGIDYSEELARYGSTTYAPDLGAHIAQRKANCPDEYRGTYDELAEKVASVYPEEFAEMLSKVDEAAGLNWYWGGAITDPYMATFGGKEKDAAVEWSWEHNPDLTADMLEAVAGDEKFLGAFDKNLTDGFAQDPTGIFDSLPMDTKRIIAGMATELEKTAGELRKQRNLMKRIAKGGNIAHDVQSSKLTPENKQEMLSKGKDAKPVPPAPTQKPKVEVRNFPKKETPKPTPAAAAASSPAPKATPKATVKPSAGGARKVVPKAGFRLGTAGKVGLGVAGAAGLAGLGYAAMRKKSEMEKRSVSEEWIRQHARRGAIQRMTTETTTPQRRRENFLSRKSWDRPTGGDSKALGKKRALFTGTSEGLSDFRQGRRMISPHDIAGMKRRRREENQRLEESRAKPRAAEPQATPKPSRPAVPKAAPKPSGGGVRAVQKAKGIGTAGKVGLGLAGAAGLAGLGYAAHRAFKKNED